MARIKIGSGNEDGIEMGPLITAIEHHDRVASYLEIAKSEEQLFTVW